MDDALRQKNDGHSTHSSEEQASVEARCKAALNAFVNSRNIDLEQHARLSSKMGTTALPLLFKDNHIYYLIKALNSLPQGFTALDASR